MVPPKILVLLYATVWGEAIALLDCGPASHDASSAVLLPLDVAIVIICCNRFNLLSALRLNSNVWLVLR